MFQSSKVGMAKRRPSARDGVLVLLNVLGDEHILDAHYFHAPHIHRRLGRTFRNGSTQCGIAL
jgi:hypothetical protein